MELYYLSKEQISDVGCIIDFMTRCESAILEIPSTTTKMKSNLNRHALRPNKQYWNICPQES
jgi:hypothetical protein